MTEKQQVLDEPVLVFRSALLRKTGYFQGLSFDAGRFIETILEKRNFEFVKRREAESNPDYKQVIPYVILHFQNRIFTYRRGNPQAEARLFNNYSIGVGGHVSVFDPRLFWLGYHEALEREMRKEVGIRGRCDTKVAAVLNDDSNEVGKAHFGIIHFASLSNSSVTSRDKSICDAKLLTIRELRNTQVYKFENWSRICLDQIETLLSRA